MHSTDRVCEIIHILLIDDDPIFCLGLRTALEPFPDLQIIAEADTGVAALEILGGEVVDLVVLELLCGRSWPNQPSGLQLCQQLKADYPNLPVLLLTAQMESAELVAAKESGIDGYCAKGSGLGGQGTADHITQIVQAIRQIISGQSCWQKLSTIPSAPISSLRPPRWFHQLRYSGLRQIEAALVPVKQQLQNPNLSNQDLLFWSGRRRELLAARWLVNQLLPAVDENIVAPLPTHPCRDAPQRRVKQRFPLPTPQEFTLFDVTREKLHSDLSNNTCVVLEIDILTPEKRRDLLEIVLRNLKKILDELRFSQVTIEQLTQKRSLILQDLWQASVTDFFGKYSTLPVGNQELEVVNTLLPSAVIVQDAILDKIPLIGEVLAQQLFEAPLKIDNIPYSARTPEAMARAEILLENLIIQVANAVIQPLLNEFADVETIKQNFYDRSLMSSREIARLRNNLSWRYRRTQLLSEPKAIFESRYNLFVLSNAGIIQTSIYAPRHQELEQLRGIALGVTLVYETRDAIAPRLQAAITWVGRGIVYILTQVVGRSIGLVVRGVIQGIGNSLQDTRFGKNGERDN